MTSWAEALDLFEANLSEAKKHLAGIKTDPRDVELLASWPPADLVDEPLPAELQARGRALFQESEAIQLRLTELKEAVPVGAHSRRRIHHPRSRPPSQRLVRDL